MIIACPKCGSAKCFHKQDCIKVPTSWLIMSCTRFTHAEEEELETYLILITETSGGRRTYLKQKDGIMYIWIQSKSP